MRAEAEALDQLALPGFEDFAVHPTPAPTDQPADADAAELPPAPAGALEGQLELFDDYTGLRRELEWSLDRGAFEEARHLRARLADSYGAPAAAPFAFLDTFGAELWTRPTPTILATLAQAEGALAPRATLRARLRRAVFARLLATRGAEAVAADAPDALPAVCSFLYDAGAEAPAGIEEAHPLARARRMVRDALLAGRHLEPLDFPDPDVRDLLAEDRPPPGLACLGVVRRLWPVTPAEGAPTCDDDVPDDEDERARACWRCLQAAETRGVSEAQLHAARRRLKRLDPALHALYLRRAV